MLGSASSCSALIPPLLPSWRQAHKQFLSAALPQSSAGAFPSTSELSHSKHWLIHSSKGLLPPVAAISPVRSERSQLALNSVFYCQKLQAVPSQAQYISHPTSEHRQRKFELSSTKATLIHSEATAGDLKLSKTAGSERGVDSMERVDEYPTGNENGGGSKADIDQAEVSKFLLGHMPKEEIGAQKFLQENPHADGRGVLVAILDTGVDPGAVGLQTTPQGAPKIVDIIDCTGSGDVDTSKVVKADKDGFITGASGARLQVSPQWANPSGEWRVGWKRLYDLLSKGVTERVKKERRKKWDVRHQHLLTDALRQLSEVKVRQPKGEVEKKAKEELQARVDLLSAMQQSYEDAGPIIDAVVWHDGSHWTAALDTSDFYSDLTVGLAGAPASAAPDTVTADAAKPEEASVGGDGAAPVIANATVGEGSGVSGGGEGKNGDGSVATIGGTGKLADFTPMKSFRIAREYTQFSHLDAASFGVNIYDEGRVLSIVTDAGAHGTHVAGIVAAYHPETPELNGIAPGAQVISCKIGDTRLGSMETLQGLMRALIAVQQHNCDVINMSYGEPVALPNYGRFFDLASELVNKHGVTFVASAGNEGPALSTTTAPGGTSSSIIGVGAYVSPSLAAATHLVLDGLQEGQQYTWSSRGPSSDGQLGVCVSAPGGACAPVPSSLLQTRMTMAGTSMASPNAAGGVALLISALKATGVERVSPHAIRRAIAATAEDLAVSDPSLKLTHGAGLLQVHRAYEYLQNLPTTEFKSDVRYSVLVRRAGNTGTSMKGIYLRNPEQSAAASEWQVFLDPWFHEDCDNRSVKAAFEKRLRIVPTADWITAPPFVLMPNNGRNFIVRIDPTALPPGVHYAEIQAIDVDRPSDGPIITVPVTVIRPVLPEDPAVPACRQLGVLQPGAVERVFFAVPRGATWAELQIKLSDFSSPTTLVVHTQQILPTRRHTYRHTRNFLPFTAPSSKSLSCLVEGGSTLEVAVGLNWLSSRGPETPPTAELAIDFHGLSTSHGDVTINGGSNVQRIDVAAPPFRLERFIPSITLNRLRSSYRPSDALLEPLSKERDMLPDGKQIHGLTLTYNVTISEPGRYTPRFPLVNQRLYDNEVEGQFYLLHDAHKRLLSCEDCYPKAVRLGKGEHVVKMQMRHDNVGLLEKLKAMPLLLDRALDDKSTQKLSLYGTVDAAINGDGDNVWKNVLMAPGEVRPFFIAGPLADKLPKDATNGSLLLGRMTLARLGGVGANSDAPSAPARLHVVYVVPPPLPKDSDKKSGASPEPKTAAARLEEGIRDAKIKVLQALVKECKGVKVPEDPSKKVDEVATGEELVGGASGGDKGSAASKKEPWQEFLELARSLKEEYPDHLPILLEILRFWDGTKPRNTRQAVAAADDIITQIDGTSLAVFCARKNDAEGKEAEEEKKRLEAQRDALIEALHKKAIALVDLCPPHSPSPPPPPPHSHSDAIPAVAGGADSAADTHADLTAEDTETQGLSREGGAAGGQKEVSPIEGNQAGGGAQGWSLFGSITDEAKIEEGKGEQVVGSADAAPGGAAVAPVSASAALGDDAAAEGAAGEELTGALDGVQEGNQVEPGEGGGDSGNDVSNGGDGADDVSGGAGGGGTTDVSELEAKEALKLFEETYEELRRWCDMSPSKFGLIQVSKERLAGRPACALKVLNKVIDDEPKAPEKRLFDLRIELLQELEWAIWAKQQQRWNVVRFPSTFTLF